MKNKLVLRMRKIGGSYGFIVGKSLAKALLLKEGVYKLTLEPIQESTLKDEQTATSGIWLRNAPRLNNLALGAS